MVSRMIVITAASSSPAQDASRFDIKDAAEFAKCVDVASAKLEKLAGDMKFLEGPVWVPQGDGYLVFSDIPANELKKWSKKDGLTTFRQPSQAINGNALDADGRLVHASHDGRAILRTEKDGTVKPLVEAYLGSLPGEMKTIPQSKFR